MAAVIDGAVNRLKERVEDLEGEVFGPDGSAYQLGNRLNGVAGTTIGSALVTATGSTTARSLAEWMGDVAGHASQIATLETETRIYADTTAGLAAVADGGYFQTPSDVSTESLILYRRSGAAAVEIKRYPAASRVDLALDLASARAEGVRGKNLHNVNAYDVALGYFPSNTTGALLVHASYNTTGFIPVTAGETYTVSMKHYVVWYDADRAFVAGSSSADGNKTQTAPAGAAFMRASCALANWSVFQVELGATQTAFEAFVVYPATPRPLSIEVGHVADGAIEPQKTSFLSRGKNLFNKATVTPGYFMGPTGSTSASADYAYSDFIPVTPGVTYYGEGAQDIRFTCYFGPSQAVVAGGSSVTLNSFTVPAGVSFVRITVWNADVDAFQLEVGTARTAYEPYGYRFDAALLSETASGAAGAWAGQTWASMGDSITAQALWQPSVVAALGLSWTNYGTGGTRISGAAEDATAMSHDTRINAIPATTNLVTVLDGTNDWAQDVALGASDSTDTTTFYGALNTMLSKMSTRFGTNRIALMTTPYGELYDFASRGWSNAYTNTQGLTTRDYAEAIRVACKRWGVPCIDVQQNAGWNTVNIGTYITDDGGLLHPNATGAARIAAVTIGALRAIEPVD